MDKKANVGEKAVFKIYVYSADTNHPAHLCSLNGVFAYPLLNPFHLCDFPNLGTVVQSIVSLTSLLVVKMLIVLVSTISNSQVFLLKKCE